MNKYYVAVLTQDSNGVMGWTVQCEHIDEDFRIETIARTQTHDMVVGAMWAQRIALAMNQAEVTGRVNAESATMTKLTNNRAAVQPDNVENK